MMEMRKILMMASMAASVALGAHGEYTLSPGRGTLPEGVTTGNINGCVPDRRMYKNGWTDQGWGVGDYGSVSNAVICPSYMAIGEECMAALTLPAITIQEGEWLCWQSRAAYPIRQEQHTVEIRRAGDETWTEISNAKDSGSDWTFRMTDLSEYAGQQCEIRFICRSEKGYMLLLNGIRTCRPAEHSFECMNRAPKFFALDEAEDGKTSIDFSIRNTGAPADAVKAVILIDGVPAAESDIESEWATDETRWFSLQIPMRLNERTDYTIAIINQEEETISFDESFAFLTSKKRNLLVDEGTGMWCNNCPVGNLEMESLEETYGGSLIAVQTHNGDPLANDIYFSWLGYRAIPTMELNRVRATAGENSRKFKDYLCLPTEMAIEVTEMRVNDDGTLSIKAEVSTSDLFSATDKTFRIGYVLTKDIDGNEDLTYYQSNYCSIATYRQYYYLPSHIPAMLCRFTNTSLPSTIASTSDDPSFTGIKESLPERLEAGTTYSVSWDIPLPTGYTDFTGMRLVAYIINAGNRNIENSTAAYVDEYSGVETVIADRQGASPVETIVSIDGRIMGNDIKTLQPGIYIINGKKVKL